MDDATENAPFPQPAPPPRRGPTAASWLLWMAFLVLVVYPLSLGPAAKLHQMFPAARPAIETIYMPLTILIREVPILREPVLWYITKIWNCH